ncbi:MAG: IS30 family transposase [Bacteroidia bacterium]|nr:IS30 family transposase [Bacteroidia bacterium]
MSKHYHQLSQAQRYQIEALLRNGAKQKEIAEIVGTTPSTICRELKRNIPKRGRGALTYTARVAHRKTVHRHKVKSKQIRYTDEQKEITRQWLSAMKYSPELIHEEGKKLLGAFVSHETIYKWIWYCKQSHRRENLDDQGLYQHLAHGKRRRKRGLRRDSRGIIPNRVSIEKRPKTVMKRKRPGDFEVDLMMGKNHRGALLVLTDRATLLTRLKLLPSKDSKEVKLGIKQKLKPIRRIIKTLTFDNDQAFGKHESVGEFLNAETYFTRPYTSQDKGTVENRIGLIRRFFPKKTDLLKVSKERVREFEAMINDRPVRKFKYKTPNQIFAAKIALIT